MEGGLRKQGKSETRLQIEVASLRCRGMEEIAIAELLIRDGATMQEAMAAIGSVRLMMGEAVADLQIEVECMTGILAARDIQLQAMGNADLDMRIKAENMRMKWIKLLMDYRKGHGKSR